MSYEPYPDFSVDFPQSGGRQDALSVSSLNRLARSLLESNFPAVLVEGEISNLSIPASGHWYLTLKDAKSQIRAAMFRNRNLGVRFKPTNGMQILAKGRLSIYEGRGDYQLLIDDLEEAGDGALRRAYEQLKFRLAEEGLFATEHKQVITGNYRHIGVITSATGAAFQDILSICARRFPATEITLLPVAVQGDAAVGEICHAVELANLHAPKLGLEVLIVGRGGGSLEDLQAFNDERVARSLFASNLPIVSAVGHEIDFTIADFVADLRAPTPSAAAELLTPDQEEFRQLFESYSRQITALIQQQINYGYQQLQWLGKRLRHPGRRLQDQAQALDIIERNLVRGIKRRIQQNSTKLLELQRALRGNSPRHQLRQLRQSNANCKFRLQQTMKIYLRENTELLAQLGHSLHAVSPLNTLARGYSITYDENREVILGSDAVAVGKTITSQLRQGKLISKVIKVESESK